jgi:hypothetical protein
MRELAGWLAVDAAEVKGIGDVQTVRQVPSWSGVGFGGHQQACPGVGMPQDRESLDQMLPALIAIEVASVEAEVRVRREAQCGAGFTSGRARWVLQGPRDW